MHYNWFIFILLWKVNLLCFMENVLLFWLNPLMNSWQRILHSDKNSLELLTNGKNKFKIANMQRQVVYTKYYFALLTYQSVGTKQLFHTMPMHSHCNIKNLFSFSLTEAELHQQTNKAWLFCLIFSCLKLSRGKENCIPLESHS